jgi:hypothetical protein
MGLYCIAEDLRVLPEVLIPFEWDLEVYSKWNIHTGWGCTLITAVVVVLVDFAPIARGRLEWSIETRVSLLKSLEVSTIQKVMEG